MSKRLFLVAVLVGVLGQYSLSQTTDGIMTGTITDSSGAHVQGAAVNVTNKNTNLVRTSTTNDVGFYVIPQLSPGVYEIAVIKQGFAKEDQKDVQLVVNQSVTVDFVLKVAPGSEEIQVTGAPPELNTTNATLGETVEHEEAVNLPLDGREFTELTLLTPGTAPVERGQQAAFDVALGAGGISPSVDGQNGQENNFTMDGVLNNFLFTNIWLFSPPPEAIQEFSVQSHMTDAQYGVSSGANVNVATRSGGTSFHGAAWEFVRNAALDGIGYFNLSKLPYTQNQYGVFFSGPVPGLKNKTFFAGYWEGFRSSETYTYYTSIPTAAMDGGDFSSILGAQVGTDDLNRPIYQNEIYDPSTTRTDPINSAAIIRDPYPNNVIPTAELNSVIPIITAKYYNLTPNFNLATGNLPNVTFPATTATKSDSIGIRIDHQFSNNDSLFGRWNRENSNLFTPEPSPNYQHQTNNYANSAVIGYTHLFGPKTILNLRYAFTDMNLIYSDQAAGTAFNSSINFTLNGTGIPMGPQVQIANGYDPIIQTLLPIGPQWTNEVNGDLTKVIQHHTLAVGGMYYHIKSFNGVTSMNTIFLQNATSVNGSSGGSTGFGPADYDLGLVDFLDGYVGPGRNQNMWISWLAGYVQDQWKASQRLTITAGLRWDFLTTPVLSNIASGLDISNGQFFITKPFLPLFPRAIGSSGYYYPQYNGYEPRFGFVYRAAPRIVVRAGFGMFDDHNHGLVQEIGNSRLTWPDAATIALPNYNEGLPTNYINALPDASTFLNPNQVYVGSSSNPRNPIPYSIEYNLGIQLDLMRATVLKLDYVGSVGRHQAINPTANTAMTPGPGPLASRGQPYPQYGPIGYEENAGSASYDGLQAELRRSYSSGVSFMASYTFSKSLDQQSDLYSGEGPQNFYNIKADWGISGYSIKHMFVFSSVYQLPVGTGKLLLSNNTNRFVQGALGNWNVGGILTSDSGVPFDCNPGGDVANVGGGNQRCNVIGDPYGGAGFTPGPTHWLNPASFNTVPYTFGTEHRDDLVGPRYNDLDFSAYKDFPIRERTKIEVRSEFFNLFNHTNFNNPVNTITAGTQFGNIYGSNSARKIQFAAKVMF